MSTPTSVPLSTLETGSNFQFTAPPIEDLGADSYTIVGICNDASGSVQSYLSEMIACLKLILDSCQKSPRSENLLLRLNQFGSSVEELHGFRELATIDSAEYDNIIRISGATALNDGVIEMLETIQTYASSLSQNEFIANSIVFVVTDGFDNNSKHSKQAVKGLIDQIRRDECLESVQIVLIGITGGNAAVRNELQGFQNDVDIDKYINIDEATPSELAKLADWISKSVSSTSQSLGSGSGSSLLEF